MRRSIRLNQRIFGIGSSWRNTQYATKPRDETPARPRFDFLGAVHQKKLDSSIANNDMVSAMIIFSRLISLRCQITIDSYEKLIKKLAKDCRLDDLDKVLSIYVSTERGCLSVCKFANLRLGKFPLECLYALFQPDAKAFKSLSENERNIISDGV